MARTVKTVTLRATVADRDIRFATNVGMSLKVNVLDIDDASRSHPATPYLYLEIPQKKYWDLLSAGGHLFIGDRGYGASAYWPNNIGWTHYSPEELAQYKRCTQATTEIELSRSAEVLDSWACMFLEPLKASVVSAALGEKLAMLMPFLLTSGYSFDLWGKKPQHYNSRAHAKSFRAALSNHFDGVLMETV